MRDRLGEAVAGAFAIEQVAVCLRGVVDSFGAVEAELAGDGRAD